MRSGNFVPSKNDTSVIRLIRFGNYSTKILFTKTLTNTDALSNGTMTTYPDLKDTTDRFVITESQRGLMGVSQLFDSFSPPKNSVTPGRCSSLFAAKQITIPQYPIKSIQRVYQKVRRSWYYVSNSNKVSALVGKYLRIEHMDSGSNLTSIFRFTYKRESYQPCVIPSVGITRCVMLGLCIHTLLDMHSFSVTQNLPLDNWKKN